MRRFTGYARSALTVALAVLGFGLSGAVTAQAQRGGGEGGWSAADAAALKGYTLTMDKMRRANQAIIELNRLEGTRDDLADDEDDTHTIDGMVARINAMPEAKAALARNGLTPRDYVLTLIASTNAAGVALVEESGQKATGIPVSRPQVEFYKANKGEIDELHAQRKASSESDDPEDDDEE